MDHSLWRNCSLFGIYHYFLYYFVLYLKGQYRHDQSRLLTGHGSVCPSLR